MTSELTLVGNMLPANGAIKTGIPPRAVISSESAAGVPADVRWSWACRILDLRDTFFITSDETPPPAAGDLVLVGVESINQHERLVTADNKRLRIYPGDMIVGVFGNRYATDAYEAEIEGVEDISLLTGGGMIGTVKSRHHQAVKRPTQVSFAGFVTDAAGRRINLKQHCFRRRAIETTRFKLVAVVGTAMNSGKTTSTVKLAKSLCGMGYRVATCKLTGSVSNRDQDEMRSTGAATVRDFSDYGFPSTYLCGKEELLDLFDTMLADVSAARPDVVVMEIADGILQRETAMLLEDARFKQRVNGLIITADGALSALYAMDRLHGMGHKVLAVSGALTSSPLAIREFQQHCDIPVGSSAGSGKELAQIVVASLGNGT